MGALDVLSLRGEGGRGKIGLSGCPGECTSEWLLLTPRHAPEDSLRGHLEFALKWEGVNLGVLAALYRTIDPAEIVRMVRDKPTGVYSRRIWFLYEWLTGTRLNLPDAGR